MKKLQRKISIGLSKVKSEDKEVSAEINPVQNGSEKLSNETGEMTQRSDAYEGESGKEKKPIVQEHQISRTGVRNKVFKDPRQLHTTATLPVPHVFLEENIPTKCKPSQLKTAQYVTETSLSPSSCPVSTHSAKTAWRSLSIRS